MGSKSIHGLRVEIAVGLRRIFRRTVWWQEYAYETTGNRHTRGRHVQVNVEGARPPTEADCRRVHRLLQAKLGRLKPFTSRRRCLDPRRFTLGVHGTDPVYRAIWFEFARQPKAGKT